MRERTMIYFIVETPYDKCFEVFFKNELGYPNFYRLTELLPGEEAYQHLTLIAPNANQDPQSLEKIEQKAITLQLKYTLFGDNLETTFSFDAKGKVHTIPPFEEALRLAAKHFSGKDENKKRHFV